MKLDIQKHKNTGFFYKYTSSFWKNSLGAKDQNKKDNTAQINTGYLYFNLNLNDYERYCEEAERRRPLQDTSGIDTEQLSKRPFWAVAAPVALRFWFRRPRCPSMGAL